MCAQKTVYCTISFNSAVTRHAPPPERWIVTLVTLILARCRKLLAKSKSHIIFFLNYTKVCPKNSCMSAEKKKVVTPVLAACRNQNFGRRVTRHAACRIEWKGTVYGRKPVFLHVPYLPTFLIWIYGTGNGKFYMKTAVYCTAVTVIRYGAQP